MKTNTKVINIHGGPGVGKSTIATGLFSLLKQKKVNCELASEYAKEITWEGTQTLLHNQISLFGEQFRRQYRLLDKVDYIISDSPLLLNAIYLEFFLEKSKKRYFDSEYIILMKQFFDETFSQFNNLNFYIDRDAKYYTDQGRVHSLKESEEIDQKILDSLIVYDPDHYMCYGETQDIITEIADIITGDKNVRIQSDGDKSN